MLSHNTIALNMSPQCQFASGLVGRSIIPLLAPPDVPLCEGLGHQPRSPSAPADALAAAGALAIKVEGGPRRFRP